MASSIENDTKKLCALIDNIYQREINGTDVGKPDLFNKHIRGSCDEHCTAVKDPKDSSCSLKTSAKDLCDFMYKHSVEESKQIMKSIVDPYILGEAVLEFISNSKCIIPDEIHQKLLADINSSDLAEPARSGAFNIKDEEFDKFITEKLLSNLPDANWYMLAYLTTTFRYFKKYLHNGNDIVFYLRLLANVSAVTFEREGKDGQDVEVLNALGDFLLRRLVDNSKLFDFSSSERYTRLQAQFK